MAEGSHGNSKLIIILGGVIIVVVIAAAAATFFLLRGGALTAGPAAPVQLPETVIWPMEPFIVNIADTNGERYLKIALQLEVTDQSVVPELELFKPKLRDVVLDLLATKTYRELMDITGKQRIREDIASRFNALLNRGRVRTVFITDFVIQ